MASAETNLCWEEWQLSWMLASWELLSFLCQHLPLPSSVPVLTSGHFGIPRAMRTMSRSESAHVLVTRCACFWKLFSKRAHSFGSSIILPSLAVYVWLSPPPPLLFPFSLSLSLCLSLSKRVSGVFLFLSFFLFLLLFFLFNRSSRLSTDLVKHGSAQCIFIFMKIFVVVVAKGICQKSRIMQNNMLGEENASCWFFFLPGYLTITCFIP